MCFYIIKISYIYYSCVYVDKLKISSLCWCFLIYFLWTMCWLKKQNVNKYLKYFFITTLSTTIVFIRTPYAHPYTTTYRESALFLAKENYLF